MFGNNGKGILGMNMTPQTTRGLQAAGLAMSQLASGRAVNLSPLHQQMLDEQNAAKMQQAIGPALERMPAEYRSLLAQMPPQLATQYIMQHMMQKPKASPIAGLEARANAAGLQPGTPEYQQFMLTGGKPAGGAGESEFGLTPQYVTDEFGNIKMLQLSKDGQGQFVELPEGHAVAKGLEKLDMGTHYQWANKFTGEPVGQPFPKNLAETAGQTESGKTGIQMGVEAFRQATLVNNKARTFRRAIQALDEGGRSGAFDRYLPDISASSAELRSAMNQAGLDVVASVTFGALSKGELDMALDTAVPRNLDEPQLRAWLVQRAEATDKVYDALLDYAEFMSKPGNTLNMWIAKNKESGAANTPPVEDDDPLGMNK